ncbi:LamG domain-containing protein [Thalassotalea sp. M1531]|uniref:LamG domain-containing protein n=2 Tax=Thalassotalea algicola TaxID=2716224 RepID=A0A7Y0Q725_9GAMM|nr:LamG domain-containing protein [Thalassotalea algicola]
MIKALSIVSFSLLVTACGGGDVESNPPKQQDPQSDEYTGPAPATEDIQKYKTALWDNISTTDKCGACHTVGNQAPYFANREDVNDAYSATNPLVDLTNPGNSRLVEKVEGGHNCWLASDSACGETMEQWIKLWSDDRVSQANTIELTAPVIREPGSSKNFPDDPSLFNSHVYPLVSQYCVDCHNESSDFAQSPFFASNDIDQAYQAAKQVINLDDPAQSRLVVRLGSEFHNCWSNCQSDSMEMLNAITAFSDEIAVDAISPEMVISKSLRLTDGITASSGGRFESDIIALYQFKTGEGNIAYDTSGISPAANLTLTGDVEWLGSWGLSFTNGKAQASTASSKKLLDLITSTGEFSVEAWVTPNNVVQEGPARIVTYSAGDNDRNFMLGQTQYNYDFSLRTQDSNTNGDPALSTPDADEVLQATLQHVVITYNATQGRRIYVNGNLIEVTDQDIAPLTAWDDSYALILGREASNQHVWQGDMRLLAVYNRVLTSEQIQQNYDVGVGEKFFLLFSVSELIELPNSYVMFEVSQFDNYSYLFSGASLVNIDGSSLSSSLPLKGIRIGLNGKESIHGQAYANLDLTINGGQSLATPMSLSSLGTIIGLEKGASQDEFFLAFEQIGEHTNVSVPGEFISPDEVPSSSETAQIGLRNFAEINHTMSSLTGVNQANSKVFDTYQLVKRQLPSIENIETFISAQQMGVTQLAIAYCDSAIEDTNIRNSWFPDVDFNQPPANALSAAERGNLLNPLINRMIPLNLANQPDTSDVYNELDSLVTRLSVCDGACSAERTRTIAKASCAAVLASAVVVVQ